MRNVRTRCGNELANPETCVGSSVLNAATVSSHHHRNDSGEDDDDNGEGNDCADHC